MGVRYCSSNAGIDQRIDKPGIIIYRAKFKNDALIFQFYTVDDTYVRLIPVPARVLQNRPQSETKNFTFPSYLRPTDALFIKANGFILKYKSYCK